MNPRRMNSPMTNLSFVKYHNTQLEEITSLLIGADTASTQKCDPLHCPGIVNRPWPGIDYNGLQPFVYPDNRYPSNGRVGTESVDPNGGRRLSPYTAGQILYFRFLSTTGSTYENNATPWVLSQNHTLQFPDVLYYYPHLQWRRMNHPDNNAIPHPPFYREEDLKRRWLAHILLFYSVQSRNIS